MSALPPQYNDDGDFVPLPNALVFGAANGARPGPELRPLSSTDLPADSWRLRNPVKDFEIGPITLTFDGQQWKVRTCGLDMRAEGSAGGHVDITTSWQFIPDPDPGATCVYEPDPAPWFKFLESRPTINRSGEAMVLQRPEVTRPWDPASLAALPDRELYPPKATRQANQDSADILYACGPWADYDPLDSPHDALNESDAVIAGEIVGSQWTPGSPRDDVRVELEIEVREVLSGSLDDADSDQRITISLKRSAYSREEVSGGPEPTGPVLLMLLRNTHGWTPFVDGLWLEGLEGPVNPAIPARELAKGWIHRGSVQALTAEFRNTATLDLPRKTKFSEDRTNFARAQY